MGDLHTDAVSDAARLQLALDVAGEVVASIGADRVASLSVRAFDGRVGMHLNEPGDAAEVAASLGLRTTVDYEATSGDFTVWKGERDGWPVALFGVRVEASSPAVGEV